jgi:hypothetical protein
MAIENNPNAPYERDHLKEPTRTNIIDRRSPAEMNPTAMDQELQIDPEMAEGPASNTRIAAFAVGIAVVLGLVFYGLNHTSMQQQASTVPTPVNSQSSPSTAAPPAAPRPNSEPGTTTGAAPANPQAPSPNSTAPGGANTNLANPGNAKQ